ncbi:MAG: cytochrome c3 family protein [Candidatus Methanoperedens sp.]|nr:cytochrome c3 family protein [Candidatus Methanoperedens sp.]
MRLKNGSSIIIGIVFVVVAISMLIIQPAIAATPNLPNNSCADCHRKLLFSTEEQRQFIDIRIKHLESGISCSIVCHEDKLNKTTASTYALWSISTHALFDVTCEKCHGGNASAVSKQEAHVGLSNISIARANTPDTCGKCHQAELGEFKGSKHFMKLESGEEGPAPACITCHQAHSVRVLTASEIEDFCSNCHNHITGIDPSVPQKAENALSSVGELQVEISKARSAINTAKAKGLDVTEAQANLDSAMAILKDTPSVWHRFNLTFFDTEVQKGIAEAQKATNATSYAQATPAATKAPGFGAALFILGLFVAYFLKRS